MVLLALNESACLFRHTGAASMSKKPFSLWTDQDICNWFDGLDEDYIRSLIDLHGDYDITPRKAFHYVFGDLDSQYCTCQACKLLLSLVPAQHQSESVAARAEVGQGGAPFSPVLDSSVSSLSVQGQAFSFTELEAAQTALICVRQALLISQTTEDQCACMAAFAAQAQRVMQLSGRGASV